MTDRPILFSGPMIRALLEGRKTQTRRVFKGIEADGNGTFHIFNRHGGLIGVSEADVPTEAPDYVPYAGGDRLWVRETHSFLPRTAYRGSVGTGTIEQVEHPTDGYTAAVFREGFDRSGRPRWRPGIHMPRWASRLTLIVTDVRVERLQEISEADALAEGVIRQDPTPDDEDWNLRWSAEQGLAPEPMSPVWLAPGTRQDYGPRRDEPLWGPTPEFAFRLLWDSLNASRGFGWDANPWVVAISFDVIQQNIDAMGEAA